MTILLQARQLWFFGDDWAFLLDREITADPWHALFSPHNEHWVTLPVVLFRLCYAVFGLDHFLPYAALPVAMHVVICALLYATLRRSGVQAVVAGAVMMALAFLGAGAENLLWSFQVTFLGSAMLGMVLVYLVVRAPQLVDTWRGRALLWSVGVLLMMTSGMAVPMLVWACLLVLLQRGVVRAVMLGAVPSMAYVLWYAVFGGSAGDGGVPAASLGELVPGVWTAWTIGWGRIVGNDAMGAVVVLVLLIVAVTVRPDTASRRLALSGWAAALFMFLLVARSRAALGEESLGSSRYAYFIALLTFPALAVALAFVAERCARRSERLVVMGVVILLLVAVGCAQLVEFREGRESINGTLRSRVTGAAELLRKDATLINGALDPVYGPNIQIGELEEVEADGGLPTTRASRQGLLDAAVALQVASHPQPLLLREGDVELFGGTVEKVDGCYDAVAGTGWTLHVDAGRQGQQAELTLGGVSSTTVRLRRDGLQSIDLPLPVVDGAPNFVGVSAAGATMEIDLPPGISFTACDLGQGEVSR